MIINYANGRSVEAVVLAGNAACLRVAIQACEDVVEFRVRGGQWFSDDLEPVQIAFAWERQTVSEVVSEADCICPKAMAAYLIQSLSDDGQETELQDAPNIVFSMAAPRC